MRQGHIYKTIYSCAKEFSYPIDSACTTLHVARSAYYKWLNGTPCERQNENGRIAKIVEDIHMESPEKGHRCIRDDLERYHKINVSDKRILRICRIKGIKSTIKYANTGCTRQASIPQHIAENLLNREFHAHRPNEKWLTDVTEFKWYEGNEIRKVYLSAILDLYDRRIVSFVIGNRNDNPLVFDTFHKAVESNPGAQPLFHSDRGYQYTNRGFHQKQIRVSDRRQPFEDTLFGRDRCDEKLESKPQRLRGNPLPVGDLLRGQTGLSILK